MNDHLSSIFFKTIRQFVCLFRGSAIFANMKLFLLESQIVLKIKTKTVFTFANLTKWVNQNCPKLEFLKKIGISLSCINTKRVEK